jgi:hypothetical protein
MAFGIGRDGRMNNTATDLPMHALFLLLLFSPDGGVPPPDASTVRALWLADLHPGRVQPGPGRFVFVPDSRTDEVDGHVELEAAGWRPGLLRTVSFARGESDEGLDVAQPIVVEDVLLVIRHPGARGQVPGPWAGVQMQETARSCHFVLSCRFGGPVDL